MNKILVLATVLFSITSYATLGQNQDSRPNSASASGSLKLHKVKTPLKIDGVLDEAVWHEALFADKFYDKDDGVNFFENTKAYIAYDAESLYVAFESKVKDKSLLPNTKLEKDDETILENEWVAFCVDTFDDGVVSYAFIVDAAGNQLDGALNASRDLSYSFSSEWTSGVSRAADGYTVEMKIPLSRLPVRLNKGDAEMAVLMIRNDRQDKLEIQRPFLNSSIKNYLNEFQQVSLGGIKQTGPLNLSGVDIWQRLAYKKSKIEMSTLLGRSRGGDASVLDYALFKKREIRGVDRPRTFKYSFQPKSVSKAFENTQYMKAFPKSRDFETFLERSQTTAFIVLEGDSIIYERYFNGFSNSSTYTSFSIAKSFVSTLIGFAIADGYIGSEADKITTFLPELLEKEPRFSEISIRDLLNMSSGLRYDDDGFPSDDDFTYIAPDLRRATLEKVSVAESPGKSWRYNNYNPLLLGMILERVTKRTVSRYLEEKLWKKMGAGDASWSLDENGFEKMESGINCSAYDYARFALLLLNKGKYKNTQVIPVDWINKSTQPVIVPQDFYDYLLKRNVYYSYFWWGKTRGAQKDQHDFFGMGNKGQFVYISPQKNLIIIRLGFEYGLTTPAASSWGELFYQFATDFKPDARTR